MQTVVGPYEIVGELASGGMAEVYEARHQLLGRRVALKVQRAQQVGGAAAERMTQEAQILEVLGHGGTVHVFDAGVLADGRTWIAMELVHGESLADRLARVGRLSVPAVLAVFHDVLDVLAAAHRHAIVHRDLKPENLILDDRGRCRVLDWGIAGIGGQRDRFARGELQPGTPHYMAPEQARGEPLDTRTDIYALGVVLFEALTGRPPFDGADDMEVLIQHLAIAPPAVGSRRPDCPTGLARMIDAMLAKSPADRPTTDELRAGLAELLAALHDAYGAMDAIEDDEPSIEIEIDIDALEPLDDDDVVLLETPRTRWTPDVTVVDGEIPSFDHVVPRT
jgi:serine/threonine-protein kinase